MINLNTEQDEIYASIDCNTMQQAFDDEPFDFMPFDDETDPDA